MNSFSFFPVKFCVPSLQYGILKSLTFPYVSQFPFFAKWRSSMLNDGSLMRKQSPCLILLLKSNSCIYLSSLYELWFQRLKWCYMLI